ncbi:MAG: gliding motility lipoprotein GldH [Bacteroidales bacterium]|nr:gliding motility lipoprotein GldH [Bacteroidales bacterium]
MKPETEKYSLRTALLSTMIAALTGLSGCRMGANDSSQYYDIDPDGWRYGDTLKYVFEPRDTAMTGDLTLSLRHTNDYIYSNIFLEITVTDSIVTRRDTLDITLADDFGRWQGRGIGTDYQVSHVVARDLQLRRPVSIGVRHIMRDEVLNDVEQVGVSFVENK